MKIHVGGLLRKNSYKTLDEAIANAYSNDVIILHKSCASDGCLLDKNLTILGNGNLIKCKPNKLAFKLGLNARVNITDVRFDVPMQSNAIVTDDDFSGSLVLDKVIMFHSGKSARKNVESVVDYYPSVILFSGDRLAISDCKIDSLGCSNFNTIKITNSFVAMLDSCQLETRQMNIYDSQLYNATMRIDDLLEVNNTQFDRGSYLELKNDDAFAEFNNCNYAVGLQKVDLFNSSQYLFMTNDIIDAFNTKRFTFKNCVFSNPLNFMNAEISFKLCDLGEISVHCTNSRCTLDNCSEKVSWFMTDSKRLDYTKDFDENTSKEDVNAALNQLDQLIGLNSVKQQVHAFIDSMRLSKIRNSRNIETNDELTMHMVFAGNAGTGKTTVARLVGQALFECGVLSENKFVESSAKDLVSGYVGQTMTKTHDLIKSALGGVLFIDEAYALAPPKDNSTSFNDEAVTQLIADAENYRKDLVIILAGYSDDMKSFFKNGNSGLRSRFVNWIEFEDYSADEMYKIAEYQLYKNKVICDSKLKELIKRCITKLMVFDAKNSGNGRLVRNFVEQMLVQRDSRLSKLDVNALSDEMLSRIMYDDVKNAFLICKQNLQRLEN